MTGGSRIRSTQTALSATRAGHVLLLQTNRRRRLLSTSVLVTGGAGFIGSASRTVSLNPATTSR